MREERFSLFPRHPWRDEEVVSLKGILLELLGRNVFDCHMHKQASLKSVRSNSDIILAPALFFHPDTRAFCGRVCFLNYMWVSVFFGCVLSFET